jgi:5-methylcytosine-specific restriction endonuclease McrA
MLYLPVSKQEKHMEYPKTRAEAKATGAKYYFTGEPCKHGHVAPRKTKGACVECLKIEWEKGNQTRAEYFRQYNQSEAGQKAKREYYDRNKAQVIEKAFSRPPKEKAAAKQRYKEANPDLYKELVSLRRRRFRQATPKWLTAEHKMEIRMKYRLAIELTRRTGMRHAVDHIVPLQGETVCGLHVPWNLEVVTQEENLKKSNKLLDTE